MNILRATLQRSFPRARGDRPLGGYFYPWHAVLPPRTRGSTPRNAYVPFLALASPAHAGIDPNYLHQPERCIRFPRARGDRPPSPRPLSVRMLLPPRTRGSTRSGPRLRLSVLASPAHAGIDQIQRRKRIACSSFPRARGDRPVAVASTGFEIELPPRTRGSTVRERRVLVDTDASPAHAGIDPIYKYPLTFPESFPRARGDRPPSS